MTESNLRTTLLRLGIEPTDSMIPTTAMTTTPFCKGLKVRIVPVHLHKIFYTLIKDPECTEEQYKALSAKGLSDAQILETVRADYVAYLKNLKGQLYSLQRVWRKLHRPTVGVYYRDNYEAEVLRASSTVPFIYIAHHIFHYDPCYADYYTDAEAPYHNGFWQTVDRFYHRDRLLNHPYTVVFGTPLQRTGSLCVPVNTEEALRLNPQPQTNKTIFKARRVTHVRRKILALDNDKISVKSAEQILKELMLPRTS